MLRGNAIGPADGLGRAWGFRLASSEAAAQGLFDPAAVVEDSTSAQSPNSSAAHADWADRFVSALGLGDSKARGGGARSSFGGAPASAAVDHGEPQGSSMMSGTRRDPVDNGRGIESKVLL